MRPHPNRRYNSCKDMEKAVHRLLKGSSVQQTDYQAQVLHELFAPELQARDQAIRSLPPAKREMVMNTGFELLPIKKPNREELPSAPTAIGKYNTLLAERQAARTARSKRRSNKQTPAEAVPDDITTQRGKPLDQTRKRADDGQTNREVAALPDKDWLSDWRVLLAIFAGMILLTMLVLNMLSSDDSTPNLADQVGSPEAFRPGQAVPGRDGFLSVSVRSSVVVSIDGRKQGMGAFRRKPIRGGLHEVVLNDLESGTRIALPIRVRVGKETIIAPPSLQ
jgi:hypothetical protein